MSRLRGRIKLRVVVSVVLHVGKRDRDRVHSRAWASRVARLLLGGAIVLAAALTAWFFLQDSAAENPRSARPLLPEPSLTPGPRLTFPDRSLYVEIGRFDNELEAYAALAGLRRTQPRDTFLLAADRAGQGTVLRAELPADLLSAIPVIERLRGEGVVGASDWAVTPQQSMRHWWDENQLFEQTYAEVLRAATAKVRPRLNAVADIVTISSFVGVPVRLFALSSAGARQERQPQWVGRAAPTDIVLARSQGRLLCISGSSVEWGETRAALQQAHGLYWSKADDYAALPVRFHPPRDFRAEVPAAVLFTYASLLLKDLGDKSPAESHAGRLLSIVPEDPNIRRELGVRRAAIHANRALTHALLVNRQILLDLAAPRRREHSAPPKPRRLTAGRL